MITASIGGSDSAIVVFAVVFIVDLTVELVVCSVVISAFLLEASATVSYRRYSSFGKYILIAKCRHKTCPGKKVGKRRLFRTF